MESNKIQNVDSNQEAQEFLMEGLSAKVKALEEENVMVKEALEAENMQVDSLNSKIDVFLKAEEEYKVHLTVMEQKHTEMKPDISERIEFAETAAAEMRKIADSATSSRDALLMETTRLSQLLEEYKNRCEKLESDLEAHQHGGKRVEKINTGDGSQGALIVELNSLMEQKMEADARAKTAEDDAKHYREQLSEHDKTSAKEQEDLMSAAEKEMDVLRTQLRLLKVELDKKEMNPVPDDISDELDRLRKDASETKALVGKYDLAIQEKEEALASVENDLHELQNEMANSASHMKSETASGAGASSVDVRELQSQLEHMTEQVAEKEHRIAHLERSKVTKEQMLKIKHVQDERKKYQEECKTLKKQLLQLKKAYENVPKPSAKSPYSTPSKSAKAGQSSNHEIVGILKDKLRDCSSQIREYEEERNFLISTLKDADMQLTKKTDSDSDVSDMADSGLEINIGHSVENLILEMQKCKQKLEASDADLGEPHGVLALEEENLELMRENKTLRRELAKRS
jgi:chromosome segregation ATPase